MITKLTNLYNTIATYLFAPMPTARKKKTLSHLPRSRKRWTAEELSDLMHMYEDHLPITQIADELDRPVAGVASKLISLGYSTKGY